MALTGMIILENVFVKEQAASFILVIEFYSMPQIISLFGFQTITSFYLYSCKAAVYIQGIFVWTYFMQGYTAWYFYFMIFICCLAYFEEFIIVLLIQKLRPNVKSIYSLQEKHKCIQ